MSELVPFPDGHAMRLDAGARAPKVYGEVARQYAATLLTEQPELGVFPEAVAAWAQAEAQVALMRRKLDQVGPFDDDDKPRDAILRWLSAFDKQAREHRAVLGLDPLSAITLAKARAETAVAALSVVEFADTYRAARLAREAALAEVPDVAGEVLARVGMQSGEILDQARREYLDKRRVEGGVPSESD